MIFEERWDYPAIYYGPKLVNHGGLCCGIKTIYGFGYSPVTTAAELPAVPFNEDYDDYDESEGEFALNTADACGSNVHSNMRFFTDPAPMESYGDRVERYINFVKQYRPQHLIEAVVVDVDQPGWGDWLNERGFKPVTEFENSNSGNRVKVYHLVINEEE